MLTPLAHQLVRPESPGCGERRAPAHLLAYLRHSVDSSNAGPAAPKAPFHTRPPAWLRNSEQSLSDRCYTQSRARSKDGQWPVAVSSHFAPVTTPREQSNPASSVLKLCPHPVSPYGSLKPHDVKDTLPWPVGGPL